MVRIITTVQFNKKPGLNKLILLPVSNKLLKKGEMSFTSMIETTNEINTNTSTSTENSLNTDDLVAPDTSFIPVDFDLLREVEINMLMKLIHAINRIRTVTEIST